MIDPKKKAQVLEALRRGDPSMLKKKKERPTAIPLVEQPTAKTELTSEEREKLTAELAVATSQGDFRMAYDLIQKGVDVNAKDEFNTPPLNYAAIKGHKKIVELLIQHGVDVNGRSGDGETALKIATDYMYPEVAELLKRFGATE
jgi:ankyrin repeat protein